MMEPGMFLRPQNVNFVSDVGCEDMQKNVHWTSNLLPPMWWESSALFLNNQVPFIESNCKNHIILLLHTHTGFYCLPEFNL
jgi:hypothetical protein